MIMLNIQRFVFNPYQENTYVVSDETDECVIIDCGAYFEDERISIIEFINDSNLTPKHLLCTHGHFDHCIGNNTIYEHYGLQPEIHQADCELLKNLGVQTEGYLGMEFWNDIPEPKCFIDKNDVNAIVNHLLGYTPDNFNEGAADVNGDGNVNISDIVALINLISILQKD